MKAVLFQEEENFTKVTGLMVPVGKPTGGLSPPITFLIFHRINRCHCLNWFCF